MNNTRKEIIGLIEPYMDKTLSYWCYCKDNWHYIRLSHIEDDNRISFHFTDNSWWGLVSKTSIDKILWHYDITAVLKYIKNNNKEGYIYDDWDDYIYFETKEINIDGDNEVLSIPFKPLHLYTEDEEKNLLKLLKTII